MKVVILTVSEASDDVTSALNAGAQGYVLKGVGSKMLAEILQGVARGETYVSPVLAARMLANLRDMNARSSPANPLSLLTQRERQILEFVGSGLSNKEVAIRLALQEKTVKHHMTRIMAKLRVRNRTEAAMLLRDAGRTILKGEGGAAAPSLRRRTFRPLLLGEASEPRNIGCRRRALDDRAAAGILHLEAAVLDLFLDAACVHDLDVVAVDLDPGAAAVTRSAAAGPAVAGPAAARVRLRQTCRSRVPVACRPEPASRQPVAAAGAAAAGPAASLANAACEPRCAPSRSRVSDNGDAASASANAEPSKRAVVLSRTLIVIFVSFGLAAGRRPAGMNQQCACRRIGGSGRGPLRGQAGPRSDAGPT